MKKIIKILILSVITFLFLFIRSDLAGNLGTNIRMKCKVLDLKGKRIGFAQINYKVFYNNSKVSEKSLYSSRNGEFSLLYSINRSVIAEKIIVKISSVLQQSRKFEFSKNKNSNRLNRNTLYSFTLYSDPEICNVEWNSRKHLMLYVRALDKVNLSDLLNNHKFNKAEQYLITRISPDRQKNAYIFMGFITFDNLDLKRSKEYFERAESLIWNNLMGLKYFKVKEYKKSLDYFMKGVLRRSRADRIFQIAEEFEKQGDIEYAVRAYKNCLKDYSKLMEGLNFKWNDQSIERSVICRRKLEQRFNAKIDNNVIKKDLRSILEKAGKYCERLKESAIYFYNIVLKTEYINYSKKVYNAMISPSSFFKEYSPLAKIHSSKFTNKYKYDYQLIINSDKSITENRIPIFQKLNMRSNKEISNYNIGKAFYGPVNLIGKEWQSAFDYKIIDHQKLFGEDTVVLEAKPIVSPTHNRLSGKIWIDRKGTVLRIEWSPYGLLSRKEIIKRSVILDRIPELFFVSEFEKKNAGFRFPSRSFIVESYKGKNKGSFVRIRTVYDYTDYQFFFVDMETEIKDDLIDL